MKHICAVTWWVGRCWFGRDNQFNKRTPRKYGIRNTNFLYYKNFKNIQWLLKKFMLMFGVLVMGGLKCVKSYCIYIAVHRLHEDGEHLLVFLIMMDTAIDLFFKVTSSNGWLWYKNRYVIKPAKKKGYFEWLFYYNNLESIKYMFIIDLVIQDL